MPATAGVNFKTACNFASGPRLQAGINYEITYLIFQSDVNQLFQLFRIANKWSQINKRYLSEINRMTLTLQSDISRFQKHPVNLHCRVYRVHITSADLRFIVAHDRVRSDQMVDFCITHDDEIGSNPFLRGKFWSLN